MGGSRTAVATVLATSGTRNCSAFGSVLLGTITGIGKPAIDVPGWNSVRFTVRVAL